jgi:hypothetical protein
LSIRSLIALQDDQIWQEKLDQLSE